MFADDTAVISQNKRFSVVISNLQHYISLLELWLNDWKIKVNASKSACLMFTRRSQLPVGLTPVTIFGQPVLWFLARLEVDPEWPWNILWTDEAHFHLDGSVNTHNCRIWETDNPHSTLRVPLHSPKVTVWCGFSASFILGPYFFEELGAGGPVTCSITGQRYASLLRNKIIPDLQSLPFTHNFYARWSSSTHYTLCYGRSQTSLHRRTCDQPPISSSVASPIA
ncbi:uncharacterized protein TNCV_308541 [Trichonephila clavipes]|nr:uncharacterized protein TNCV_308541 [Trichonephila clavipes]